MNDYEREMQEQAESIERWRLRKEIKKKLRALRKMLKGDIISLPHLQIISKDLATLVDFRTLEALRILEEKGKDVPAPQNPTIIEHKKQVEMKVDVVLPDTLRENPAKNIDSPTLPLKKGIE